ncbi:MAG: penicillin acylase family protein [Bdellovibrionales bacterium]
MAEPLSVRVKTAALVVLAGVLGLLVLVLLWSYGTLPRQFGSTKLKTLSHDVDIIRDDYGVPHIFAQSANDAYAALGFVHAQDRLFQMDMMRRAGAGRLSEVIGEPTLKTDRLFRTLGLYSAAADSFAALGHPVRAALQAYASGVNAFIAQNDLPLEFRLLGYTPEAWKPADSLVWLKLMAFTLGGSWRDEITAAQLAQHISVPQVAALMGWSISPKRGPVAPSAEDTRQKVDWNELAAALPPHGPRSASNGWVVNGRMTASGKPQLANDPHLGLSTPILWYLARIVAPDVNVTGATAPGFPFHVLGQNNELAWGITSTNADTADLFVEKVTGDSTYLSPFGEEEFVTYNEVIKIKGKPDEHLTVRLSRHGPVISGVEKHAAKLAANDRVISLLSTMTRGDDTSAEALYLLNRARTPYEVERATNYVQAPVQNLMFADRRGNIGLRVVGSIPVRRNSLGVLPGDGTLNTGDWVSAIPRLSLPRWINPSRGWLSNANEAIAPARYPHLITALWMQPYRAMRLQQLLGGAAPGSLTHDVHAAWQNDDVSVPSLWLRDSTLALLPVATNETDRQARDILKAWNGHMALDAAAPVVLAYLEDELLSALLADELGDAVNTLRPVQPRVLVNALNDKVTNWCDNSSTKETETCADIVTTAWQAALERTIAQHGAPDTWAWGHVNIAPLENKFWQNIPVIGAWVDQATPVSGGNHTLKRAGKSDHDDSGNLFGVDHAAGYRGIYTAGDPENGRYIISTGQSGSILSPDYANQVRLWADGGSLGIKGSLSELDRQHPRYLTLIASEHEEN